MSPSPELPVPPYPYAKTMQRFVERYATPEGEDDFERLLRTVDKYDEAWRVDGFEGMSAFLTPNGQWIGIGRRLHEDERDMYARAWERGQQPIAVDLHHNMREQTYRVMHRDEVHDVTIPPEFQRGFGIRAQSRIETTDRGHTDRTVPGINGIYGISYIYAVEHDATGLGKNMPWLIDLLGNSASLAYNDTHFIGLHVYLYVDARISQLSNRSDLPSIEEVARHVQAATSATTSHPLDMPAAQ